MPHFTGRLDLEGRAPPADQRRQRVHPAGAADRHGDPRVLAAIAVFAVGGMDQASAVTACRADYKTVETAWAPTKARRATRATSVEQLVGVWLREPPGTVQRLCHRHRPGYRECHGPVDQPGPPSRRRQRQLRLRIAPGIRLIGSPERSCPERRYIRFDISSNRLHDVGRLLGFLRDKGEIRLSSLNPELPRSALGARLIGWGHLWWSPPVWRQPTRFGGAGPAGTTARIAGRARLRRGGSGGCRSGAAAKSATTGGGHTPVRRAGRPRLDDRHDLVTDQLVPLPAGHPARPRPRAGWPR